MAKPTHTEDLDGPGESSILLPATGSVYANESIFVDEEIETINADELKRNLDMIRFMEERVDVMVAESADPNAEQYIQTYVNGVPQLFERGVVQSVKRMFVEALARAMPVFIQTVEYIDPNGGKATKINKTPTHKYPFSVINDPSGKVGYEWLKSVYAGS
jgi:hypothetical protein